MAANSSAGGPVGAPPTQAQNLLAQQQHNGNDNPEMKLNTYIYDHLLRTRQYDIARVFIAANKCHTKGPKGKPNGIMDDASDPKRPDGLPEPDVYETMGSESSFLLGWWCMFWDVFSAAHRFPTARPGTLDYVQLQKARYSGLNQQRMPNQLNMPANGVFMKQAGSRNTTPNMAQMQQAKMMAGQQMQRDPSGMDMAQRPQTPMENAPSPSKRPRLDSAGSFEAQNMAARQAAAAAGQMPNMMGTAAGQLAMQNGLAQQQMQQHFAQNGHPKIENMAMLPNNERMEAMEFNASSQGQGPPDNRHALQDYQMQLMMLEQQNKKRLLQARRDNSTDGSNQAGTPGNQMYGAPNMSPSTSRGGGPSPNASDVKRGTPKTAQQALPGSPMNELQNRSSPAPNFDASGGPIPPGLQPQYYANMAGTPRAPSSHPGNAHPTFQINPGITQAQMEQIQRGQRMGNGMQWPQGGQQVMQGANQAQAALRAGNMGPPPAPANEAPAPQQRTQPSSPAQQPAPPTPSQANKAAPKKKEAAAKKKNAPKKGATASTPAESTEPPTPTTSTPMPSATFAKTATPTQAAVPVTIQQPQPLASAASMPSGLDPGAGPAAFDDPTFNLDFADIHSNEVFESVDFDSFLHSNDDGNVFNLDNMTNFDPVEAGTSNI